MRVEAAQKSVLQKTWDFFKNIELPRLIILGFVIVLFVLARIKGIDLTALISDSIRRIGMAGILVLAMVPTIRAGVGLNFGLPLGIVCGLIGALISMQMELTGATGFLMAIFFALPFAIAAGLGYAWLLLKVKGQEMMVGTYFGFSSVAFMNIFWLILPFNNPEMIWAVGGKGLRYTLTLNNHYAQILNNALAFEIGGVNIPTGLLLFYALFCFIIFVFFKTKSGLAVDATGQNEEYARSSGINTNRMRTLGVVISNVLGAVGIIVYAQSYGFLQLYNGPMFMAFPAVAAVLIGGATLHKASITNAIIGTILFQTVLTISLPVTSQYVQGDVSEVARLIISNGMIVYALTRGTGKGGKTL